MPIEDWISDPIAAERHERVVEVEPERAIELALSVPVGSDPIVSPLLRLRGLMSSELRDIAPSTPLQEVIADEFVILDRGPREVVAGIGAPVWTPLNRDRGERLRDADDWEQWDAPRSFKAVMTFSAEPMAEGPEPRCRLVTETQVVPTDDWARRAFKRYWRVVGPFSALIRRRWLRAIAKAAERE